MSKAVDKTKHKGDSRSRFSLCVVCFEVTHAELAPFEEVLKVLTKIFIKTRNVLILYFYIIF